MIRCVAAFVLLLSALACRPAMAQSAPTWAYKYVPQPSEWQSWFAKKRDEVADTVPYLVAGNCVNGTLNPGASDNAFTIVFAGNASSCQIVFGKPRQGLPACVASNSGGSTALAPTPSSTGVLLQGSFIAMNVVSVICEGK